MFFIQEGISNDDDSCGDSCGLIGRAYIPSMYDVWPIKATSSRYWITDAGFEPMGARIAGAGCGPIGMLPT